MPTVRKPHNTRTNVMCKWKTWLTVSLATLTLLTGCVTTRTGEAFLSTKIVMSSAEDFLCHGGQSGTFDITGPFRKVIGAVCAVSAISLAPASDLIFLPEDFYCRNHGFWVHVSDQDRRPASNADLSVFVSPSRSCISGLTDSCGSFYIPRGMKNADIEWIVVKKKGYYDTHIPRNGGPQFQIRDLYNTGTNVWELTLRQRVVPVPMNATRFSLPTSIKTNSADLAYDCEVGDWLPPFGVGKQEDLHVVATVERYITAIDYRYSVLMTAPGRGNGFVNKRMVPYSDFRSEYRAPLDGYNMTGFAESADYTPGQGSKFSHYWDAGKYLIFRVRSEFNDAGELVKAHYGKLMFPAGAGCTGVSYFNPEPNNRSIEFDPKRNPLLNNKPQKDRYRFEGIRP